MGQATHANRQSSTSAPPTRRRVAKPQTDTFAPVPSGLITLATTARKGSAGEPWLVMVWAVLDRLAGPAGSWRGSRNDLATACGTSDSTIKRVIRTLTEHGWLTVTSVTGEASLYTPNRRQEPATREASGAPETTPTRVTGDPGSTGETPATDDPGVGHQRPGVGSPVARVPAPPYKERARVERETETARLPAREPDSIPDGGRAGSTPSGPSPLVERLGQALTEAGVPVGLVQKPEQTADVEQLIDQLGIPALVQHARAQYRPDHPAASMAAFLTGWRSLPRPAVWGKDGSLARPGSDDGGSAGWELVGECKHGDPHGLDIHARTGEPRCALCRSDRAEPQF